jgi:arylsulfatase A-like enzyme
VFIAAGPTIVRAAKDGLPRPDRAKPVGDAVDVLPTLLAPEGIPLGKDFEGNVLHDVIDPDFLARVPVRYVDTHDDKEWDQARRLRMKEAEDRAERLEQLRSLGYIN